MSSALPAIAGAARAIVRAMAPSLMRRVDTLGMTPRQQELNHYWSWYATCRYDARKVDWDGSERIERIDAEGIATAGVLPPGFYDAGQEFPLKFRRPSAPYNLPRVIVNRFTGLLFSEATHPRITCIGDPGTEDYVGALADAARLWASMAQVRTYGGAQGTYCVGFKFIDGRPRIEVHDPRWVTPRFKDMDTQEVVSIDKRWMWPEYQMGESGEWEEVWFWTRRIIDERNDITWHKVPVGDGNEPDWQFWKPDQAVAHGFGFCPVVWGQNVPVSDAVDGEPDCLGVYDQVEEMDSLIAQSGMATKRNLDPTVVIATDRKLGELRKGSDNAVKLEKGGTAGYMEGTFEGSKQGMAQAMALRGLILEVAQCVLENPNQVGNTGGDKTATEVRADYSSMLSRADGFREQYGQKCVLPLMDMMLRAVRILNTSLPGAAPNGGPLRRTIKLPPREMTDEAGNKTYVPRELPEDAGGVLGLLWPPYFPPSPADMTAAVTAAVQAYKTGEFIDLETAVRSVASYFRIDDVPALLRKVKAEVAERQQQADARAAAAFGGGGGGGGGGFGG